MRPSHPPARASVDARARPRSAVGVLALLAVLATLPPLGARAASPEPEQDPFPAIQTWIDGPINAPPDAPAGAMVQVGATFWSDRDHALWPMSGLVVRLHPAKGNAKPSVAKATMDVPGHIVATLPIPKGGAGRVEIDTEGQECTAGGACTTVDLPLRISGTGPPPDAPRSALVRAQLLPIVGDVVADRPAPIAVVLNPIGLWDFGSLQLPPTLQVLIDRVGGGRLGTAKLEQGSPEPGYPYQGTMVIPDQGEMRLTAALVDASGVAQPIEGELGRVLVIGSGRRPDASAAPVSRPSAGTDDAAGPGASPGPGDAPATSADSGPPILILVAIGVLVLGLLLFLGEPLTRRLRGGSGNDDRR